MSIKYWFSVISTVARGLLCISLLSISEHKDLQEMLLSQQIWCVISWNERGRAFSVTFPRLWTIFIFFWKRRGFTPLFDCLLLLVETICVFVSVSELNPEPYSIHGMNILWEQVSQICHWAEGQEATTRGQCTVSSPVPNVARCLGSWGGIPG